MAISTRRKTVIVSSPEYDARTYAETATAQATLATTAVADAVLYAQTRIDTVADVLADTVLTYALGNGNVTVGEFIQTRKEGFSYEVAASGATDHHITTAGGVKLYVVIGSRGYNVKAFGAVGDNSTDDTAAINLAAVATRAQAILTFQGNAATTNPHNEQAISLYFPQGRYKCLGEIWIGSAGDYNDGVKNIDADIGAMIISHNSGGIAVNWAGVFGGRWTNLTVWGDGTNVPDVGLLCARVGTAATNPSSGAHQFYNAQIFGNYNIAAYYNYGSEINRWNGGMIKNSDGLCTLYFTANNAGEIVTSANCSIDTTYQSSYGDEFFGTIVTWDGTDSVAGQGTGIVDGGALAVVQSMSYGPKFHGCYFDMLQGAGFTEMPYFRFEVAVGETGTSSRTQSPSFIGCQFENQYYCIAYVENRVDGLFMHDNTFATGAVGADIVIPTGGSLYGPDVQPLRGSTLLEWTTWDIVGTLSGKVLYHFDVEGISGYHITESSLTLDDTWRALSLTAYGIPATARSVNFKIQYNTAVAVSTAKYAALRSNSGTPVGAEFRAQPLLTGMITFMEGRTPCTSGAIEYKGHPDVSQFRLLFRSFEV